MAGQILEEDAVEDEEFGPDFVGDELPEELARRETRLEKIRAAKARLEQRQKEEDRAKGRSPGDHKKPKKGPPFKRRFGVPPDEKQDNFTDSDSRIMKDKNGFQQCYNAQAAVEEKSQLIVATGLTHSAADVGQLEPLLEAVLVNTGQRPQQALADAGYKSEGNFLYLEDTDVTGYVALGKENDTLGSELKPDPACAPRPRRSLCTATCVPPTLRSSRSSEPTPAVSRDG